MIIWKEFTFDSAHFLPNYDGDCAHVHGHTYRVQIGLEYKDEPGKRGMLIDFKYIKKFIVDGIIKRYDHKLINKFLVNPTAENMVMDIFHLILEVVDKHKDIFKPVAYHIKLWETPTSYVEYTNYVG